MDFSELPYEIQFQYLLGLPYQSILSYCQTSASALVICQTEEFWNRKALNDFGIGLRVIDQGSPAQRYARLERLYRENPEQLILQLIKVGDLAPVPALLNRIDRGTELNLFVFELIDAAVETGSSNILQQTIRMFEEPFTRLRYTDELNDFLRGLFFQAVVTNRLDLAELIRPYYDWRRDSSEYLQEWFWQWGHSRDPKTLASLARAGITLPEYEED